MIRRTDSGWLVDVQPGGRAGRRLRKTLATKGEAERWQRWVIAQTERDPDWNPPERDRRRLSDLARRWHELHGVGLRDGAARLRLLLAAAEAMGDPVGSDLVTAYPAYRAQRLAAGISPHTVNRERSYWRAVFGELVRLGEWREAHPLALVRPLPAERRELSYLDAGQVSALLAELRSGRNLDAYHVARLCLATGARWGEAASLRVEACEADRVTFSRTKSGHARTVPVDPALLREVVRGRTVGRLFVPCYAAFRHAIKRAGIDLPRGQAAHVLRHTFASHFVQRGGSILTLQRILGHSSVTVTMVYAHLAPDHLEEARRLNPLAGVDEALTLKGKGPAPSDASP